MNTLKFRIKVVKARFSSLRREVLFLGGTAFLSIIMLDFLLKKFPAINRTMYDFGQVYIKLCYSYFSAFIFYLLVVHFPRERRRLKSFRFLSNKISHLYRDKDLLFSSLFKLSHEEFEKLNRNEIVELSKKIDPRQQINAKKDILSPLPTTFQNHYQYINFMSQKMKENIYSLLSLGDVVDNDLIYSLTCIDDTLTFHFTFEQVIWGNTTLEHKGFSIAELNLEIKELSSKFNKNYNKYQFEYHHNERKKTRLRT